MHPRNPHNERYDIDGLVRTLPELKRMIIKNKAGLDSINFDDPAAVRALNKAILMHYYGIKFWEIPEGFLCPPIPGRADYIHHLADLVPGAKRGLDIGAGANCIYPLIGHKVYGWDFIGSDINGRALQAAQAIINANDLDSHIELRIQPDPANIFHNIIKPNEHFDFTMCNPPFHASEEEALAGTDRKWKNLKRGHKGKLNFGGQSSELWTEGGEKVFICRMMDESAEMPSSVRWFTTMVSKEASLPVLEKRLKTIGAPSVKIINMSFGQKKSRILAWSFSERSS